MAEAIERALADKKHLIVEAGTGTGKTLAYLVPAILSGRRVIVSTGTKTLQEQLFFKDIPFLQQHFQQPLRACLMKGRANYLCRQKVYDAEREAVLEGLEEVSDYRVIRDWEKVTETGDRAELKTLPERSSAWEKMDARRDRCSGQKCPQFERCFVTEMQRRAHESDVIVVNHHLFFADLAVKQDDFGGIIPSYNAVIFDEAHELEDVAGQYFGISVSNYQIEDLSRDIASLAQRKAFGSGELDRALLTLQDRSEVFFRLFGDGDGRQGFDRQAGFLEANGTAYEDVLLSLELVSAHLQLIHDAPEELIPVFRRCKEIMERLRLWMESGDPKFVYWIERRGRGRFLQATPIDVSSTLHEKLFDNLDTVILTSATLAVGGEFDYAKQRLGLRSSRSLHVEGMFDYRDQAMLYAASHLPEVRSIAFPKAAANEVIRILQITQGRAFVLFTSLNQMRQVYEAVKPRIDYPLLLQGSAPKNTLLEQFRRTKGSVLFASSSFWQGVDVQGDQLSCVIVDKLPFAVPSDPVVDARIRAIRESGGNPFYDYQIPEAALALKQGFGRLIRSRSDRGVLVMLDNRMTKMKYGRLFLESLPPYSFTTDIQDVQHFLES